MNTDAKLLEISKVPHNHRDNEFIKKIWYLQVIKELENRYKTGSIFFNIIIDAQNLNIIRLIQEFIIEMYKLGYICEKYHKLRLLKILWISHIFNFLLNNKLVLKFKRMPNIENYC